MLKIKNICYSLIKNFFTDPNQSTPSNQTHTKEHYVLFYWRRIWFFRIIAFSTHSIIFFRIFWLISNFLKFWTLWRQNFRRERSLENFICKIVRTKLFFYRTNFSCFYIISFSFESCNRVVSMERFVSFLCKCIKRILKMICCELTDRVVIQEIFLRRIFVIKIILKIWYRSYSIIIRRISGNRIHFFLKNLLL